MRVLVACSLLLTACGGDFVVKAEQNTYKEDRGVCIYQEYEYGFNIIDAFILLVPTPLHEMRCEPYSIEALKRLKQEAKELNDV